MSTPPDITHTAATHAEPTTVPDPDLPLLHTRSYDVRAYRKDTTTLLLRGIVSDVKPAGLYVPDDPEPLRIHHMVVDLDIDMRTATIIGANVVFEEHPHSSCPTITEHYEKLIGLSISRGFTHKVRELFGGPRGCTHVTALLQAMGPVVNQSRFSMAFDSQRSASNNNSNTAATPVTIKRAPTPEERQRMFAANINTCHVWDEHGEHVTSINTTGRETELPLWIAKRFKKLGRSLESWGPFQ